MARATLILALLLVGLGLICVGCGSSQSPAIGPCIVTLQGATLCGAKAEAWCNLVESQTALSGSTRSACDAVHRALGDAMSGVVAFGVDDPDEGKPCDPLADTGAGYHINCVPASSPNATPATGSDDVSIDVSWVRKACALPQGRTRDHEIVRRLAALMSAYRHSPDQGQATVEATPLLNDNCLSSEQQKALSALLSH